MAKLYDYYAATNTGKPTSLLQSAYNDQARSITRLLLTAALDDRYDQGHITSRIVMSAKAELFHSETELFKLINTHHRKSTKTIKEGPQVEISGNDRYISVCRKHFKEAMKD